ncbi:MAG: OmpA family protein [Odoribacteraceae bacterium]|nr:OmpA family protein [Odoribacteraceae bacterium]
MRKTFILFMALAAPFIVVSQEQKTPDDRGFVSHGFWENWFITLGAGAERYLGEHDLKERFGDALHPAFDLSVGKWIMPTVGIRLQASGFNVSGLTGDPTNIYVKGNTPVKGNLYAQKWRQFNVHVDGLLNVSNWWGGYKENRFYEFVPFAGFGVIHAMQSDGMTDYMVSAGLVNKFRVSNHVDLNLELRGNLVPEEFDGESGGKWIEGLLAASVGVSYKINNTPFKRPVKGVSSAAHEAVKDALAAESARAARLQAELDAERNKVQVRQATEVQVRQATDVLPYLFFQIGSATLAPQEIVTLKQIADVIKQNTGKVYHVTGYADRRTGSEKRNCELSEQRAHNVADALIHIYGVNRTQLIVSGKGGVAEVLGSSDQLSRVVIVE